MVVKNKKLWRYQGLDDLPKNNEYCEVYHCSNCGEANYVFIKKGIKSKVVREQVECMRCGCPV